MITLRVRAVTTLWVMTAVFIASQTAAQTNSINKLSFSIGGELGLVTGYEQSYHSVEAGAIAQLQYRLTNSIAFTLATGYEDLFSETYQAEDFGYKEGFYGAPSGALGIVPVKAGIRVFTDKHFYFSAEAGTWIYSNGIDHSAYSVTYSSYPGSPPPNKESHLLLAPGLGWFSKNTDVGFRFDFFSTKAPIIPGTMYYGIASFHVAYILR